MTVIIPNQVPPENLTIVGIGRVEPDIGQPERVDVQVNLSRAANQFEANVGRKLNLVEGQDYFVAEVIVGNLAVKILEFDSTLENVRTAAKKLEGLYNASINKIEAEAANITFD